MICSRLAVLFGHCTKQGIVTNHPFFFMVLIPTTNSVGIRKFEIAENTENLISDAPAASAQKRCGN
ncbi:MAG: hypothetical protein M3430_12310, partial [Acidobacteriota bacterium]|nr:hypothetical protein [Acidobacteriota bacterium]